MSAHGLARGEVQEWLRQHVGEAAEDILRDFDEQPSLECLARALAEQGFRARVIASARVARKTRIDELRDGDRALEVLPPLADGNNFILALFRHCLAERELRQPIRTFPLCVVGFAVLGYALPALTQRIVDYAIPHRTPGLLMVLVCSLVVVGALQSTATCIENRTTLALDARLSTAATHALFTRYLNQPLARLRQTTAGEVAQTLAGAAAVVQALIQHGVTAVTSLALCWGYLAWLATLNLKLALALAGLSLMLGLITCFWAIPLADLQERLVRLAAREHDRLLELIDRVRILRASGATPWALGRYSTALREQQSQSSKHALSVNTLRELLSAAERLALGGAILAGSAACLAGQLTLGELFVIVAVVTAYLGHQADVLRFVGQLVGLRIQLRRMNTVLAMERRKRSRRLAWLNGDITIERVWFRYDERSPWVLKDYSLTIPAGSIQNIEWPSGAGKSTLLRLISGLYEPSRGEVRVGGVAAHAVREKIAYIPQGCTLTGGSINANLRLLSNEAPTARILAAAEETGLASVLASWPMGFDTPVTAGGRNLSSGQRQLVALTAALASSRPILLLDEATTHVDAMLRARLKRARMLAGRTIVNVVHGSVE